MSISTEAAGFMGSLWSQVHKELRIEQKREWTPKRKEHKFVPKKESHEIKGKKFAAQKRQYPPANYHQNPWVAYTRVTSITYCQALSHLLPLPPRSLPWKKQTEAHHR